MSEEELPTPSDKKKLDVVEPDPPCESEEEASDYETRLQNEQRFYKDCSNVHDLPEIFHYWSNKYLAPEFKSFGFSSPDDFFAHKIKVFLSNPDQRAPRFLSAIKGFFSNPNHRFRRTLDTLKRYLANPDKRLTRIVSIGAGNCDLELELCKKLIDSGFEDFSLECLDLNTDMLERGRAAAREAGLSDYLVFTRADFNEWKPAGNYEIVMANQSLHHVLNLEGLFESIRQSLSSDGLFLISDMIGRNGHMRWPEAMMKLKPFWAELPESYRFNRLLKRHEQEYINHDCSDEGFEGIRAQDILPLLVERFHFNFFFPYANIIFVFIDRPFGHNFDDTAEWDRRFIDRVHAVDEEGIMSGELKPTSMLAVLTKQETETVLRNPALTPGSCVRKADIDIPAGTKESH